MAYRCECVQCGFVERVQVLLGRDDAAVAHALLHILEVGATGEEPGSVSMAEVMLADLDRDPGSFGGRLP